MFHKWFFPLHGEMDLSRANELLVKFAKKLIITWKEFDLRTHRVPCFEQLLGSLFQL